MQGIETIRETLGDIEVGEARRHGSLTVFALISGSERGGDAEAHYIPLGEALERGLAEINEVSDAGSVPTLRARNHAGQPVFLLDGEELVGAKQNRVVNVSLLLPPNSTLDIPVSCVEAGRWSRRTPSFESAGRTHFARARARKAAQVSYSLAAGQSFRSDQSAVWDDIDVKAQRMQVDSRTSAMADIYESHAERLAGYRSAFPSTEGQIGAVFAIGKVVLGAELFRDRHLLDAYMPAVVEGYALDAIEEDAASDAPEAADAEAFVGEIAAATFTAHDAVGLGEQLRIRESGLAGGALVHEDAVVHLGGFRLEAGEAGDDRPGPRRVMVRRGRRR